MKNKLTKVLVTLCCAFMLVVGAVIARPQTAKAVYAAGPFSYPSDISFECTKVEFGTKNDDIEPTIDSDVLIVEEWSDLKLVDMQSGTVTAKDEADEAGTYMVMVVLTYDEDADPDGYYFENTGTTNACYFIHNVTVSGASQVLAVGASSYNTTKGTYKSQVGANNDENVYLVVNLMYQVTENQSGGSTPSAGITFNNTMTYVSCAVMFTSLIALAFVVSKCKMFN